MIRWRTLFDQYDPEGFGEIPWPDFMVLLARGDFREEVVIMMTTMVINVFLMTMTMTTIVTTLLCSWPGGTSERRW